MEFMLGLLVGLLFFVAYVIYMYFAIEDLSGCIDDYIEESEKYISNLEKIVKEYADIVNQFTKGVENNESNQ